MKRIALAVAALVAIGILVMQARSISMARAEIAQLRQQLQLAPEPAESPSKPQQPTLGNLPHRLANLERVVGELSDIANVLVERGTVPPTASQAERMQLRFFDTSIGEGERLRALRLLRRNGG